jgi:hypothetical protein
VVPDRLRGASWWRDFHAAKLVGREYVKYLVAVARLLLVDAPAHTDGRLAKIDAGAVAR